MNLLLADLPEDPNERAEWLDRQVVSTRLPQLAGELAACHLPAEGASTDPLSEQQVRAFVDRGAAALSAEEVAGLLRQPQALLELQHEVLGSGGDYWAALGSSPSDGARLSANRARLEDWLVSAGDLAEQPTPLATSASGGERAPMRRFAAVVGLAASLMLAFWAGGKATPPPKAVAAWGWQKPSATDATLDRDAYLSALADAADDWFKKRPTEPEAFADRVLTFRRGCSHLLLTKHAPLDPADSAWLKEKCLAWAEKIDGHLLALERGEPLDKVREAMDETVRKLSTAIRGRANA